MSCEILFSSHHCSIELAKERQSKKALESKSSNQILKLAENNASLARLNNALSNQLEKLRGEHERLLHLSTGQQAVAKAKSVELIEEIDGLKKLLKESQEEKEALRSHLNAKQVGIPYNRPYKRYVFTCIQEKLDLGEKLLFPILHFLKNRYYAVANVRIESFERYAYLDLWGKSMQGDRL